MTAMFIDGVHVVFEGLARLHWAAGPWRFIGPGAPAHDETANRQPVLEYVWPRRDVQAHIRRQIEHGQRTVVVIDGREPIVTLPRHRAPHVPFGAREVGGAGGDERRLLIARFSWLGERDRSRGENFLDRTTNRRVRSGGRPDGTVVVERDLIGSPEPLRFVYCERQLSLGRLQWTIEQLFRPVLPSLPARPAANGHRRAAGAAIRAA